MKDIHGGNIWGASRGSSKRPGDILDFSASINPLGLPPGAVRAVKRSLGLVPPYPDPDCAELKEALSDFYSVPPEEILPANGSTQLIYLLPEVLRPERALIIEPAFSEYRTALRRCGSVVDGLVLGEAQGFSLDLKRLGGRLERGSYGLVYIASPANPTGVAVSGDALKEAALMCAGRGATLVVDEAFADFAEEGSIIKEAASLGNVIVLRSMTKFFSMAGLRLGFMVSSRRMIKAFSAHMPPWSVNTLASAAAGGAMKDIAYQRAARRWLDAERPFLFDGLRAIPGLQPFPSATNFLLVKLTLPGMTAPRLRERLLEKGIMIRELSAFRGLGRMYFRVAVRMRQENAGLIGAIGAALKG